MQFYEEFCDAASDGFAIGLAPMEGVTDFAFRLWQSALCVPDFFVTPFLRVTPGFEFEAVSRLFCPEIFELRGILPVPVIPQFMGSSSVDVCRAAEKFLFSVPYVDLNCGCPASGVFRHGAGSALLRDPSGFLAFLAGCEQALGARKYSVKMRVGVHSSSEFENLLHVLGQLNPAVITVHARTKDEGYTGVSRWNLVEQCAREMSPVAVCLSGDVVDIDSLKLARGQAPSIKSVMIGRAVLSDPWVFADIAMGQSPSQTNPILAFWALATFALFQHAQAQGYRRIFELAEFLLPADQHLGFSQERWRDFYYRTAEHLLGLRREPWELLCNEKVLNKTKQLVRQMVFRRVTPHTLDLLRVSTLTQFFEGLWNSILKSDQP